MPVMPIVDLKKCDGCGLCVNVCGCGAISLAGNGIVIVETEACGWCTLCEAVCPTGAVSCPYEIVIEEFQE